MFKIKDSVEFEIVECIAEGGMGAVYKAYQKGVDGFVKTVAVKTLLAPLSSEKRFVDMFRAEALLVANLVHENIVQIYQLGKYEGNYYFVIEYVDGITLHEFIDFHIKLKIKIPLNLAVFIASRIARGLAYAHSRTARDETPLNIVHCDVCPSNVLITTEGLPKLTDFGIAKAATMVSDGTVSGKLPFMSPEQASGKALDFRSDIYSLGIVLFYLISGEHTRDVSNDFAKLLEQAKSNYINWGKFPDEFKNDRPLMNIIEKCLAPEADQRYCSTAELARELEYYIYKDGYGPTIVTLAKYMRENMAYVFEKDEKRKASLRPGSPTLVLPVKTTKITF
ncbi:MAG: hypothetical protein A2020_10905 [Lentisphaerae bacterium GWF2_45_14]|nr:MAG: hypothetical protein A2020_10905 [Lentisphaerae bacterium GWF2_45_14]